MNNEEEKLTSGEVKSEADKLEAIYYCEKCDSAWWHDETGVLCGSKIPEDYKENFVNDVEHKLCRDCEKTYKKEVEAKDVKEKKYQETIEEIKKLIEKHGLDEVVFSISAWIVTVYKKDALTQLKDVMKRRYENSDCYESPEVRDALAWADFYEAGGEIHDTL